jgi:hypothetical protein
MLIADNMDWVEVKEGASVCWDGQWLEWPPTWRALKTPCKIEGRIRKRTRMRLMAFMPDNRGKTRKVSILAWFHDLRPLV